MYVTTVNKIGILTVMSYLIKCDVTNGKQSPAILNSII
jgi:hypothetical protein